jgi:hypothetical protein
MIFVQNPPRTGQALPVIIGTVVEFGHALKVGLGQLDRFPPAETPSI